MGVDLQEAIEERLRETQHRIAVAAARSGRREEDVSVVAVSKTFGADVLRAALDAGITALGENRAQEFKQKVMLLGDRPKWHFVGHLQTNKVRDVVGRALLIHSVDRMGLASAMAQRAQRAGIVQDVLIEVNVSGEAAKFGIDPSRAVALAEDVAILEGLRVGGLMTMAPFDADAEASRPIFSRLRGLGRRVTELLPEAIHLSMGMTRDFEIAIEEGATIVRLGEAIFGPRI